MSKAKALIVAVLVFGLFWYVSNFFASYEIGVDIPLFGWLPISAPLAEFSGFTLVVGAILALIIFVALGGREH